MRENGKKGVGKMAKKAVKGWQNKNRTQGKVQDAMVSDIRAFPGVLFTAVCRGFLWVILCPFFLLLHPFACVLSAFEHHRNPDASGFQRLPESQSQPCPCKSPDRPLRRPSVLFCRGDETVRKLERGPTRVDVFGLSRRLEAGVTTCLRRVISADPFSGTCPKGACRETAGKADSLSRRARGFRPIWAPDRRRTAGWNRWSAPL